MSLFSAAVKTVKYSVFHGGREENFSPHIFPLGEILMIAVVFSSGILWAGPPFVTDDPEPVELHHWEFYVASQVQRNAKGIQGTVPNVEINFGAFQETQLHIITPVAFSKSDQASAAVGLGDIEAGVKFRFLKEGDWRPQAGIFPHVLIPAGDTSNGLGAGHTQLFLPVWLQKSFGKFCVYGGGGYWTSPGFSGHDYWSLGLETQYAILDALTVGVEIFHNTPAPASGGKETGINAGTIVNISSVHHVLASAGADIAGPNRFMAYIAYQLTI
jgi:hypothetical protein